MAGCRYLVLSPAAWTDFAATIGDRHQAALPACPHVPGLRWNADRSALLVKMHGADKAWRQAQPALFAADGAVQAIFDRDEAAALTALLAAPEWAEPEDEQ